MKLLIAFALICTICALTVQGAPKWGEDHEHDGEHGDHPHHHHHHHHHHGRFRHHHRHGDCSKHQHPETADKSSEEKGEDTNNNKSVSSESLEHQQQGTGTLDAHSIGNEGGGEIDNNKPIEDASQLSGSSATGALEPHILTGDQPVLFEEGNLGPHSTDQQTEQLNDTNANGLEQSAGAAELNAQPNIFTEEVLQSTTGTGADDENVDLRSG